MTQFQGRSCIVSLTTEGMNTVPFTTKLHQAGIQDKGKLKIILQTLLVPVKEEHGYAIPAYTAGSMNVLTLLCIMI